MTSNDGRVSTSGGIFDQSPQAEAEKHLRRFEGHNLRIGPGRKVHRVKVSVRSGLKQPTPVCGQPVSRYPLFDCEAVDLPADCRRCHERCTTRDPCARLAFPEADDGQLALFEVRATRTDCNRVSLTAPQVSEAPVMPPEAGAAGSSPAEGT